MQFKTWEDLARSDCPLEFSGQQVRDIREHLTDWTQADLAKRFGVTRQAVAAWERRGLNRTQSMALRFAVIYDDIIPLGHSAAQKVTKPAATLEPPPCAANA